MDIESYFKDKYNYLNKYIYVVNIEDIPLGSFVKTINKYTNKPSLYGFVYNKSNNSIVLKSNKYYKISTDNYYIFYIVPTTNKFRKFLATFISTQV
jgi:hypothetical protein